MGGGADVINCQPEGTPQSEQDITMMNSEHATADASMHPLDPTRIGPDGLVARLFGLFETAIENTKTATK